MLVLKILIAEDEALIAMLLEELLTGLGHSVCASVNSEANAVTAAHEYQPDIILMDVGLRGGSGIAAMATINASRITPHVFMTGDAAKIREQLPDAILIEKPFFENDLVSAMDRALNPCAALLSAG